MTKLSFYPKRSLVTKNIVYKEKSRNPVCLEDCTFGLSVFLFTESKQGFMHQLLRSMNKQQRVARTF